MWVGRQWEWERACAAHKIGITIIVNMMVTWRKLLAQYILEEKSVTARKLVKVPGAAAVARPTHMKATPLCFDQGGYKYCSSRVQSKLQ